MKIKDIDKIDKQLNSHLIQISKARNNLAETISELQGLMFDCDEAIDGIRDAKSALDNARDALSKLT